MDLDVDAVPKRDNLMACLTNGVTNGAPEIQCYGGPKLFFSAATNFF